MNDLVKALVEGLIDINESSNKIVGMFGGGFKPPTLGHLEVVKRALEENPEMDELVILVGSGVRDSISQEESLAIWNTYKKYLPSKVKVIPSPQNKPPIGAIYSYARKNPNETIYWFIGAREGNEEDFQDIEKRTRSLRKLPYQNVKVKEIVTGGAVSGTKARQALLAKDKETFLQFIPDIPEVDKIWDMLTDVVKERVNFNADFISKGDVEFVDDMADRKLAPIDVDLSGNHFFDRLNDPRNFPDISIEELEEFFDKLADEKDDFIEFLKKYKDVVVKDTDTNINIPFMKMANKAIAKTIMRKKNFKTPNKVLPLNEGKYDFEVTSISRMIINFFKESLGKEVTEKFEDVGELNGEPYDLELYLRPSDFDLLGPTPFIINAAGDEDAIAIQINYQPEQFPDAYNELIPELKDAIRHELEHTAQGRFDKGVASDGVDQDDLPLFDYLTLDYEIPAFVQGIYKNAKTRKIKFSQALQNFLDERADDLTPDEEAKVKKIYTDFAKKNLPAAQFEGKDPKKGTGKKPKGSGRRLYTDENPKDTVKIKFSTRQDIVDTLGKASFKSKSHARQSQVINLIHQRVRAAYNRAKKPDVKKRLKTALDYITQRKEASKEKTKRLQAQKKKKKTNEALEGAKRIDYYLNYYINVSPSTFDIAKEDDNIIISGINDPYPQGFDDAKDIRQVPPTQNLNENVAPNHNQKSAPFGSGYKELKEELTPQIISLTQYMGSNGLNLKPYPKIKFINNDAENANDLLGRTAYYDPNQQLVALYTMGRHPKDILRSYAHELVHHHQNLNGTLDHSQTTNTNEDGDLERIEREAYENGNILFRNWEDSIKNDN